MMTDVACFCGCLYSFDGGAGACPRCGECAAIPTGSALTCSDRGQLREPRICFHPQDGQNGQAARSSSRYDRVPGSVLPDGVPSASGLAVAQLSEHIHGELRQAVEDELGTGEHVARRRIVLIGDSHHLHPGGNG